MKKIYYLMLAMTACLLSSCFDDDGNYTYTEVPEISISGLGETHVLNSYSGEMLEIDPVIESDYTDLTYEWYMWSLTKEQEGSTGAGEAVETELISTDKKLSWEVACPIGYYRIMLKVTSPSNGYFVTATTQLEAQTMFTRGFYILKETADGNTEIDMYDREGNMLTDLLEATDYGAMKGKPLSLGVLQNHSMLNAELKGVMIHSICVTTEDGEVAFFNTENMELTHDASTIKTGGMEEGEKAYTAFTYGNSNVFITSKGSYVAYVPTMLGTTSGVIDVPAKLTGGSQFVMSDGDYGAIYWSNEEERIEVTDHINFGSLYTYNENGFSTKGMDCLACGLSQTDAKSYFILNDANNTRYIYELDVPVIGVGAPAPKTVKRTEVPADSKLASATAFAVNAKTTNLLYYVSGNQLYSYNLPNYTENPNPITLPGMGAGETITYLSYQWQDYSNDTDYNFIHLVVGTQNGDNYKLYMYNIAAGVNLSLVQSFGGKGKLKSCAYVSPVTVAQYWNEGQNYYGTGAYNNNSLPN